METELVGMVPQPVLFTMNLTTSWVLGQHLLQQCCLRRGARKGTDGLAYIAISSHLAHSNRKAEEVNRQ